MDYGEVEVSFGEACNLKDDLVILALAFTSISYLYYACSDSCIHFSDNLNVMVSNDECFFINGISIVMMKSKVFP